MLKIYEQVYDGYNVSKTGVVSREEFARRAEKFLSRAEIDTLLLRVGVAEEEEFIPFDKFIYILLPKNKTISPKSLAHAKKTTQRRYSQS